MEKELIQIKRLQYFGSHSAADQIIRSYYDEIYMYSYKQLGNKADALDMTQEIFIAMLHSIKQYDASKASFRTWLYRIATNKIIDYRRKMHLQVVELMGEDIQIETDLLTTIENTELLHAIERYVSRFESETQAIFRLHIYFDKSFPEISEIIQLPEASVKSKYYRLQKKIRKEFGEYVER